MSNLPNGWKPAAITTLKSFLEVVKRPYLILDTETTGLDDGEIVQIAILSDTGKVLLDTLVKPSKPIPPSATTIHGITDEMVADSPRWGTLHIAVANLLKGQTVVVYNAAYDRRMMHQSDSANGLPRRDWRNLCRWACAMEAYAELWGDWNSYHRSYRWQRLSAACEQQGLPVIDAHAALGDCRMTLALINAMKANASF